MKRTDRYFRTAKIDMLTAITFIATSVSMLCWYPQLTHNMGDSSSAVEWLIVAIVAIQWLMAWFSIQSSVYHFRMARAAVRADQQYEPTPRL